MMRNYAPWSADTIMKLGRIQLGVGGQAPYLCQEDGHVGGKPHFMIPGPDGLYCPECSNKQTWCNQNDLEQVTRLH